MADLSPPADANAAGASKPEIKADVRPAKPLRPPNPMWKYMGFGENFRPKIPSRNWLIFLSVTGTFTAAVIYDKREKKRAQRKWCKLVEHLAKEPIDPRSMPRRLTVFLEGPPTDGLRVAQDHFKDYVKPILVASGLDWDFVQGRKEGDIRAGIAEKIRNSRLPPEERTEEDAVAETRRKSGIKEFDGSRGDIVIGRHTWKEYVRGVHEGWLGPLTEPPQPASETPAEELNTPAKEGEAAFETAPGITLLSEPREASSEEKPAEDTEPKPEEKPKKTPQPKPYITTLEYKISPTPPELPEVLDPSQPISFPHILGFLNTPKRLWRFLHKRDLADSIGREVAATILCTNRPYHTSSENLPPSSFSDDDDQSPQSHSKEPDIPQVAEQQTVLIEEEKEWHKNTRVRVDGEPERTWLEAVVLDPRIASRMRRFELSPEDEARAKTILVPEEEIEGWIKGGLRSLFRKGMKAVGIQKEKKPVYDGHDESLE